MKQLPINGDPERKTVPCLATIRKSIDHEADQHCMKAVFDQDNYRHRRSIRSWRMAVFAGSPTILASQLEFQGMV